MVMVWSVLRFGGCGCFGLVVYGGSSRVYYNMVGFDGNEVVWIL